MAIVDLESLSIEELAALRDDVTEKVGRKGDAIDLYRKRKMEALQGKKLPEKLRAPKV